MATYSYKAKSFSGKLKKGAMGAKSKRELAKILRGQGYILISATSAGEESKKIRLDLGFLRKLERISLRDKLMFTKNLQVMTAAGVSLPRALRTLSSQTKNKKFQRVLLKIAEDIQKGTSFSESLKNYSDIFSELFCHMIKVGEESGTLGQVLENLAIQIEKAADLRSKVKSALIYPAVIISVMIIIAALMLIVVVPKLADVFKELAVDLPLTTQIIINLGTFLADQFLLTLTVFSLFLLSFYFILKTQNGRQFKDGLLLKIPVIAPLIKKINTSYIARNLSLLTASGVSFLRSLEVVAGILPNVYFKKAILEAEEAVKKGDKFSKSLEKHQDIFPDTVIQMLQVGEETGETSKILEELAEFFEKEVAVATQNLVSLIEPLLMVIIGAVVGFFAISMIQPIYAMLGAF